MEPEMSRAISAEVRVMLDGAMMYANAPNGAEAAALRVRNVLEQELFRFMIRSEIAGQVN
jgi:hypothetical protein